MTDLNQLSILEVAEQLLLENKEPMSFIELFQAISDSKGLSDEERNEIIAQVYADFIISAKFVYVGEDQWDLKSRQSIDLWDKDGAYYDEFPDYEEELEELETEEVYEDEEEEADEEEEEYGEEEEADEYEDDLDYDDFDDEEEDYIEDESDIVQEDEEDFDDEKYNEYMDDYEKMYDE